MGQVDKWKLSQIVGVPPRAICRWLRCANSIPHDGDGHTVTFPLDGALEWLKANKPALHERMVERAR